MTPALMMAFWRAEDARADAGWSVNGLQKVSVFRDSTEVVEEDDDMVSVTDTENPT